MINWDTDVLAPLMDASVFGETVQPIYTPQNGTPFPIDGVFDDAYILVDVLDDGEPGSSSTNPVLGVRLSQFPAGVAPQQNDTVYVASVAQTFIVDQVRPDGHGWAKLELNATS